MPDSLPLFPLVRQAQEQAVFVLVVINMKQAMLCYEKVWQDLMDFKTFSWPYDAA